MNKISCAIVGGTGYTAGELLRILLHHPLAEVVAVQSSSQAGNAIASIHRDLIGDSELCFCNELPKTDILFICLGHGLSARFLEQNRIDPHTKVIDLGNDFRLEPDFTPATDVTLETDVSPRTFVYGLPELFREEIAVAQSVANPGCFATAIQLALLPLVQHGVLKDEVHIHAITGSTGAGRGLSETGHFSYRNNNVSIYKPFTHQHLDEIHLSLSTLHHRMSSPFQTNRGVEHSPLRMSSPFQTNRGVEPSPLRMSSPFHTNGGVAPLPSLNFIPVRGDFTRGIFATLYTRCPWSKEEAQVHYTHYYQHHPFTHVSPYEISLKEVVNTNKCLLHLSKHNEYLLITATLDNLLKGASGQAVQNMNLMFGLDETLGLHLKPTAF